MEGSSTGDVKIYGANVALSGTYAGNVTVVASNHFTLGENTHISGSLKYSAPEELAIPATSEVEGGARYTGAYAYVPTSQQVHQFAVVGSGIFFAVRILAGVIVAGLIAGLFPLFSERISSMALSREPRSLLSLLGIGIALALLTPPLCLLLFISFVGAELALLLMLLYALLILLSFIFCGVALGLLLRRTVLHRVNGVQEFSWSDAVIGTICVHVIGLVPILGTILVFLFALVCAGALARSAYQQAFMSRSFHAIAYDHPADRNRCP